MTQQQCDDCGTKYSGTSCPECAERATGIKPEVEKQPTNAVSERPQMALAVADIEVDKAVATAHAFPRDVVKFQQRVGEYISDPDVAIEAWYSLPKGGKCIEGPSVRLAEIVAANYGNCSFRVADMKEEEKRVTVTYQGIDLETNFSVEETHSVSIWGKYGRYKDNMIETSMKAAKAMAYRDCVFKIVPASFVKKFKDQCHAIVGKHLDENEVEVKKYITEEFEKMSIKPAKWMDVYGFKKGDHLNAKQLKDLLGVINSMKSGYSFAAATNTSGNDKDGKKKLQGSGTGFSFADLEGEPNG